MSEGVLGDDIENWVKYGFSSNVLKRRTYIKGCLTTDSGLKAFFKVVGMYNSLIKNFLIARSEK